MHRHCLRPGEEGEGLVYMHRHCLRPGEVDRHACAPEPRNTELSSELLSRTLLVARWLGGS